MAEHVLLTVRLSAAALVAVPALPGRLAAEIASLGYRVSPSAGAPPALLPAGAEILVYQDAPDPEPSVVWVEVAGDAGAAGRGDAAQVIILPADTAGQQDGGGAFILSRLHATGLLPPQPAAPGGTAPGTPVPGAGVYSDAEEAAVAQRLAALGYIE
jgi:hypothetical protein